MSPRTCLTTGVVILAIVATGALLLSGLGTSQAVQNPSMSFDMITAGNTYVSGDDADFDGFPDPGTNHMTVGTINDCLATAPPGAAATHIHSVHMIIQNVEDLIGWQARVNYIGDKMRVQGFSGNPFSDNFTGGVVGFATLPLDGGVHRDFVPASSIPAAPADGTNTPQTALFGGVYNGAQTFAVSPDTPQKAVHDETNQTYGTTGGGVLASVNLSVIGNEQGQQLFMDLDDNNPNPPGSAVVVFDGIGTQTIDLAESALGDGLHGEGVSCSGATPSPSPTPAPSPSPTPPAVGGHDARLKRIGGVPKSVRLSAGEVITDSANVVVANDSNHTETIGVYVDVFHGSTGCTPNGRVLQTTVSLVAGDKTTIPVPVNYSCSNPSAADGLSFTWTAVADHGADDLSSCGPGSLQSLACFNGLANDDEDPADNRKSRTGPKVIAQQRGVMRVG